MAQNGSTLEIGVKADDDLREWVDAIRSCATRSSVCMSRFSEHHDLVLLAAAH